MKRLAVLAAAILVSAPVFAECSAADKRALEEWDRAWGDATRSGNRAALQQIYSDDYQNLNLGGNQTKSQAIEAAMRNAEALRQNPNPAPPPIYDYYIINCTPNTAVVTHRNTVRTTVDGKEQLNYSRSVHILEKRGGKWQVLSDALHGLNDAAALAYLEKEWGDAMLRKDAAWFERNFASDYSGVDPMTGAISTKSQAIAELKNMSFDSLSMSDLSTRIEGNTAVVTGIAHASGKMPDGQRFEGKARFTDVFVKRDARWQVLSSHLTMINEPPAAGSK